jgi:Ca-activated chloride channel homolog
MMKHYLNIAFLLLLALNLSAQKENKHIREGNKQYSDGNFTEAQTSYLKAMQENNNSFAGGFNLGNSLYKQQKFQEAAGQFNSLAQSAPDKELKAKAYHNLGNALLKDNKVNESIEAYKNALRNNPNDEDTRYNLAYAMRMKQEQENNKEEQKEDKNDQQKPDQNQQKDQKEPQQPKDQLNKEEAQRLLDAMDREDKNTLEKIKKQKSPVKVIIEKDW